MKEQTAQEESLCFWPTCMVELSVHLKALLDNCFSQIYGSTRFSLGKDLFPELHTTSGISHDSRLQVTAHVTDNSTGEIYMKMSI